MAKLAPPPVPDSFHFFSDLQSRQYCELLLTFVNLQEQGQQALCLRLEPQVEEARATLRQILSLMQSDPWNMISDRQLKQAAIDAASRTATVGLAMKTQADKNNRLLVDVNGDYLGELWHFRLAFTLVPPQIESIEREDDPWAAILDGPEFPDVINHPLVQAAVALYLPYGLIEPVVSTIVAVASRPMHGKRISSPLMTAFMAGLRGASGTLSDGRAIADRELSVLTKRLAEIEADHAHAEAALRSIRQDKQRLQAGNDDFDFIAANPDVERIFVEPPKVEVRTRPIVIPDEDMIKRYLGPLVMTFDTSAKTIRYAADQPYVVTSLNDQGRITAQASYASPHCHQNGTPCFGEGTATIANLWLTGRLTDLIVYALNSIRNYNRNSAYCRLNLWPPEGPAIPAWLNGS